MRQPDKLTADGCCTLRRMAFEVLKNAKAAFCSNLLCAYCLNKLPEQGPIKARLCVLSIMPLWAWAQRRSAHPELSPLYLRSTLCVTHVIKNKQVLSRFSILQAMKSWTEPGNEATVHVPF